MLLLPWHVVSNVLYYCSHQERDCDRYHQDLLIPRQSKHRGNIGSARDLSLRGSFRVSSSLRRRTRRCSCRGWFVRFSFGPGGWRRRRCARLFLGSLFIAGASVVCYVKAGPFKNQTSPSTQKTLDLSFAPGRLPAQLFWAHGVGCVLH
jgi:hypothetical protein